MNRILFFIFFIGFIVFICSGCTVNEIGQSCTVLEKSNIGDYVNLETFKVNCSEGSYRCFYGIRSISCLKVD